MKNISDRTEGDVNTSLMRAEWQKNVLSDETRDLLNRDSKYFIHQSLSTPCINALRNAEGIYIEDYDGRQIMDFHGNNVHQVGFKNHYVIDAVKKQIDELPFCSRRYTNSSAVDLAEKLVSIAPGNLGKVLFAPGATSAVGMALKLARKITGSFKTVSMWDSFHGASLDAISVGGEYLFKKDMGPMLTGCEHVIGMNTYRCPFGECSKCGLKCLSYLEMVLEKQQDVGAVIIETIRNTDVQIPYKEYMIGVRKLCDKYGALLILDETAIAFGRTGKFFAFENFDIVPDMVVVGKGFGGGIFPMAALIVKENLDISGDIALGHYTHEKSPVGSAASLAVIEYIDNHNLLHHSVELGDYFKAELHKLAQKHLIIGDIRGIGLLVGVELVNDRITKEKAIYEAEKVMYSCIEKGLSFKISQGNVLTLSPPLIIKKSEIDNAVKILDQALTELKI